MRLVAIYCAWSDCLDLLEKSIDNILPVVDHVIVVWSHKNNHCGIRIEWAFTHPSVSFVHIEPMQHFKAHQNETMKRNVGIDKARGEGYTHFLMMDSDEFYLREDVSREKDRMEREDLNGLVCGLRVYIKEPTLWCEDHTLVPFIQKLTKGVCVGDFKSYPFAYDKDRNAHIDPTRRPSHRDKIGWSEIVMHHFSYVRQDIDMKINSSSANLKRSRDIILDDLANAKEGYMSKLYHRELKSGPDLFGLKNRGARTQMWNRPL